ncbi:MAG: phosphotransferase [Candidatus Hodarchaeales archaeon]|jgi:hypothetical protein
MVEKPTNSVLENHLSKLSQTRNLSVKSRNDLDKNPFAHLETLFFHEQPETPYILKSVVPYFSSEIHVHRHANRCTVNGARLIYGYTDSEELNFILMEKIQDLKPIYLVPQDESIQYYYEIAEKLADFHLRSQKSVKSLKKLNVHHYGTKWYQKNIKEIAKNICELSDKINHEIFLSKGLVKKFEQSIQSLKEMFKPFEKSKLTVVHGDFDVGNIFIKNDTVCAIDWGMGHLDAPMIDIAHLVNALGDLDIGTRRSIFAEYFERARKLYPKNVSMHYIRNVGTLMHILFFLNFQLYAVQHLVNPDYFYEQIHNRVKHLVDLLYDQR